MFVFSFKSKFDVVLLNTINDCIKLVEDEDCGGMLTLTLTCVLTVSR